MDEAIEHGEAGGPRRAPTGQRGQGWRRLALAGLAALGLAGCGYAPESTLNPAGPVAQIQFHLTEWSFWIMVEIFAVVFGVLVVILLVFRERKGREGLPPQVEGNSRLELLWTLVPALLLALLAVGTVKDSFALAAYQSGPSTVQVTVTGHQFWWDFNYPQYGIDTANELHIPVGKKVELALKSADVMHAFWIPRLGGKTALVPGRTNYMWIEADKPGTYTGQCAEFCGTGHADMRLLVVAETPAKFQQWVQSMQHPVSVPSSGLALTGYHDFQSLGCSSCHTIAGTPYHGPVGPNLTDLTDRRMIAANLLPNTPANLARWIHDPQAVKPGALMPNLHLNPQQIKAVVAYLDTLK